MNQLPDRIVHLPIIWRGKRLFSARLRLAVHEAALPDVLAGEAAQALATLPVPAGADGLLLRCVVDPGWRTRSLRDDSVAFVLSRDVWHYLAWTGRYEDFLEGRYSAKTRESYARDEARLLERCGQALDLREYREPAQVDEFAGHLARLRGHGTPLPRGGCTLMLFTSCGLASSSASVTLPTVTGSAAATSRASCSVSAALSSGSVMWKSMRA